MLTLQERDPDARAYIAQHFLKANVSVVRADFDGEGHEDYTLLLRNDRSAKALLVVVLCRRWSMQDRLARSPALIPVRFAARSGLDWL